MQTGRDRKDANRSGLKGCEQVGTEEVRMERNQRGAFDANHQRGVNHRTVEIDNRTPIALCREWTHMMAIGCRMAECDLIVVEYGRPDPYKWIKGTDLMGIVSPEDGLGTIAYKAKGMLDGA
ncbi:hypothetical protein F2Q69_00012159 [Brassica cretica]|uniref:Uncharacterized protein n=1 Tax=Brassica cretica TaxID=69181 RepID=A0A8S9R7Z4_BRACR|nr:hypothetical protein F2Q69_00012159 [Brassica cretica]